MLAIRMQRTGRKGHAMFRVVVQDSRRTPSSGRVVALLGSYDPHTKAVQLEKDKADFYLKNGAQPSERVVRLFQSEGVTLPSWVKSASNDRARTIRNPEKLRRNQPKEEAAVTEAEAPVAETSNE
jgi:small subunit ribosomal protein S16